ncbi:uncharacterized protein [Cardiocondyla obscurior]|uniref:uncharacterized protein n=1 Tax=Cardiocondyla obscurior TaxID=286306 RepID=UPI0039656041
MYEPSEYTEMIVAYGLAGENANRAAQIYAERMPGRVRYPCGKTILNAVKKLRETGCLVHHQRESTRRRIRNEEQILNLFEDRPEMSIRRSARELNLTTCEVHRTLRYNSIYPYRYQRVQQLLPRDYEPRMHFCQGFLAQCRQNTTFPDNILWSDEALFTQNGIFNSRNTLYWVDHNPKLIREGSFQYRYSINVWAGILENQIIGPYFLPARLTGLEYRNFIRTSLPVLLENVPLKTRRNIIFQHDGAPAHSCRAVREELNLRFPEKWIGRGRPIAWPARSPDLTVCDFFSWGYIKSLVDTQRNGTANEVRESIIAAFGTVSPDIVLCASRDVVRRAEFCIRQRGGHFEQLLH